MHRLLKSIRLDQSDEYYARNGLLRKCDRAIGAEKIYIGNHPALISYCPFLISVQNQSRNLQTTEDLVVKTSSLRQVLRFFHLPYLRVKSRQNFACNSATAPYLKFRECHHCRKCHHRRKCHHHRRMITMNRCKSENQSEQHLRHQSLNLSHPIHPTYIRW